MAATAAVGQGASRERPKMMTQVSLKNDDYFPSLNIPLRTPEHTPSSKDHRERAAKAVEKGYFRQSSKYVLPSLANDTERTYEPGRLMMLPDRDAVAGLKKQMKLQQSRARKNAPSIDFYRSLQKSFLNFESIVHNHTAPTKSALSRQKSFINNIDPSQSNALKLALKEEQKFENKARGAEKRKKALKGSLEDLSSRQISSRAPAKVHHRVHHLKALSKSVSKESLARSKRSDKNAPTKTVGRERKRGVTKQKDGSNSDSDDAEESEEVARRKLTARETIHKVQVAVRKIGPILVSSARHRHRSKNAAGHSNGPPSSRRPSLVANQMRHERKGTRVQRQSTTTCLQPKQARIIKKLQKGDRRATMANLPEFEALANESDNRFIRLGDAREYFISIIRKIMIILCWWQEFSMQYQTMENQMKTFFDMAQELEEETTRKHIAQATGIAFDPKDYKASKEINLSSDIKKILTIPPHARNLEQCQKVMTGLQSLKSFAEYPLHMQEKLAKVAWYQEVSPKRVILRQGHFAENFYFILSGFAVVKIIMKKKYSVSLNVVARLSKGQSFGEIALLHHSQRTATVESGNHMTMLSIDRDDFLDIFFNMKDGEEPEHVTFCRKIPFLKDWPIERIHENPGTCMFHFFRRGAIVVPDSTKNEWIYIVKTGSCRILKRLQAVESVRVWSSSQLQQDDMQMRCRYGAIVYDSKVDNSAPDALKNRRPRDLSPIARSKTEFFTTKPRDEFKKERSKSNVSFADMPEGIQEESEESEGEEDEAENGSAAKQTAADTESEETASKASHQAGFSRSRVDMVLTHRNRDPNAFKGSSVPMIRRGSSSPERSYVHPAKPPHSTFIELRKLRKKDVFGLEDVQFDDEYYDNPNTSVMLVSDGAELIMLSRKLFVGHANEFVRQYVREHVKFFPSEEILQENLQTELNWDLFRGEELVSTLMQIHDDKSLKLLDSWA